VTEGDTKFLVNNL